MERYESDSIGIYQNLPSTEIGNTSYEHPARRIQGQVQKEAQVLLLGWAAAKTTFYASKSVYPRPLRGENNLFRPSGRPLLTTRVVKLISTEFNLADRGLFPAITKGA